MQNLKAGRLESSAGSAGARGSIFKVLDRTAKEAALHLGSFLGLPEGSIVGLSFHTKVLQAWDLIETNSLTVLETRHPASYWLGSFPLSPLSLMVDGVFPLWLHWIFPPHIYVLISSS